MFTSGHHATLSVFVHAGVLIIIPLPNHQSRHLSTLLSSSITSVFITSLHVKNLLICTGNLLCSPSFLLAHSLRSRNPFLFAFFLLCGDVEPNPGPTNFTLCTLNIRSILQPLHSAALCDFIDTRHPDLFCLTETLIKPTTAFTELKHC